MDNRKGQMFLVGILILVMAIIIFIATIPAMKGIMNSARGCSYLNCAGYLDLDATVGTTACASNNQTYVSTQDEDTIACTVLDIALPLLILSVLAVAVMLLMRGRLVEEAPPQPMYGGY